MSITTFVNLPVRDLPNTTEFFAALGFSFNPQASNENVACLIISEAACAMLHTEASFAGYTGVGVTDTETSREVIVGLQVESRQRVDELVEQAVAAGGQSLGPAQDQGFMYMRGFRDLDGHQWSALHLDMSR